MDTLDVPDFMLQDEDLVEAVKPTEPVTTVPFIFPKQFRKPNWLRIFFVFIIVVFFAFLLVQLAENQGSNMVFGIVLVFLVSLLLIWLIVKK